MASGSHTYYWPGQYSGFRIRCTVSSQVSSGGSYYRNVTFYYEAHRDMFTSTGFYESGVANKMIDYRIFGSTWEGHKLSSTPGPAASDGYRPCGTLGSYSIWSSGNTSRSCSVYISVPRLAINGTTYYLTVDTSFTLDFDPPPAPPGTKDTLTAPNVTANSAASFTITHNTSGNKNTITYSCGSQTGYLYTGSSGSTNFITSTATTAYIPASTTLAWASQFPNANSATVSFTITTYNSAGSSLGSQTISKTFTIPSYSYTNSAPTIAKTTLTSLGSYIAGKTTIRVTAPSSWPAAQYGGVRTGTMIVTDAGTTVVNQAVAAGGYVDITPSAAGTVTATYKVTDGRPNTTSGSASASVTYVANPGITINSFTASRNASTTTTISGSASITWGSSISGNSLTVKFTENGTQFQSGTSTSFTRTGKSDGSAFTYKVIASDTIGNQNESSATVSAVFKYIQVTENKVISIGKAASTGSNQIEMGLPIVLHDKVTSADSTSNIRICNFMQFANGLDVSAIFKALCAQLISTYRTDRSPTLYTGRIQSSSYKWFELMVYDMGANSNGYPRYSFGRYMSYGGTSGIPNYTWGTTDYTPFVHEVAKASQIGSTGGTADVGYQILPGGTRQICWYRQAKSVPIQSGWGSVYTNTEASAFGGGSWARAFSSTPSVTATFVHSGSGNGSAWALSLGAPSTTSTGTWQIVRPVSTASDSWTLNLIAIGNA